MAMRARKSRRLMVLGVDWQTAKDHVADRALCSLARDDDLPGAALPIRRR